MKRYRIGRMAALATLSLPVFLACGAEDAVDNAVDCDHICDRYQECFDDGYDTEACESRCKSRASDSEDFEDKVDACENCIDDESCASGTFECADDCIDIVP